jgi:hypothetical protein
MSIGEPKCCGLGCRCTEEKAESAERFGQSALCPYVVRQSGRSVLPSDNTSLVEWQHVFSAATLREMVGGWQAWGDGLCEGFLVFVCFGSSQEIQEASDCSTGS